MEEFKQITNASDSVAKFYLESAGGNLELAITNFYNQGGSNAMQDDEDDLYGNDQQSNQVPQYTPISSNPTTTGNSSGGRTLSGSTPSTTTPSDSSTSKSTSKPTSSSGRRFATMSSIKNEGDQKPNPKDNSYYAGGSQNSGQQIIGASDNNDDEDDDDEDNHFADKIFKAAQKQGAKSASEYADEQRRNQPKFAGSGRRLGNTTADSSVIPSSEPKTQEKVVTITFYSEGFTVDDGELRLIDAPENREFIESINKGMAPRELYTPGYDLVVNLVNKKTEKYSEQPRQFKAFVGSGRSLGASSSASSSSSSVKPTTTSSQSKPPAKLEVDATKPTTSLQIRMADGTRLVGKFNTTHTVGDLRQFIRHATPSQAPFDIMTQYPTKVLTEDSATLEESGLKGATVIQKLK